MLHLSLGRKLLLAFAIAFLATNIPIVRVEPARIPPAASIQRKEYPGLDDPNAEVRAAAALAIREANDTEAVPALIAHLNDPDQKAGLYVAQALIDLAPAPALNQIRDILRTGYPNARWRAAYVLGERRDVRSIPSLARALYDREVLVSRYAAEALANIDTPSGIRALVDALASTRQSEVYAAGRGLLILNNAAVPQLARALESTDQNKEANAALVLQMIGTPEAQGALRPTDPL